MAAGRFLPSPFLLSSQMPGPRGAAGALSTLAPPPLPPKTTAPFLRSAPPTLREGTALSLLSLFTFPSQQELALHIPHRVAASPAPSPHLGLPPGTLRCGAVHLGAVWPHFVELCLHHCRSRQKPTSCHKALHFWQSARSDTQLHPPSSSTVPSAASPRRPQPPGAPTPLQARDQGCPALPVPKAHPNPPSCLRRVALVAD